MFFPVLILRGSDKIPLASYEYKMNTYFTPLMDVTVKRPVWSEYNFPSCATVQNTILVSTFLDSMVIGTCVDLEFFLAWLK